VTVNSFLRKKNFFLIFFLEDRPCLIYGLRGVICYSVTVSGPLKSNHSGVDGGVFREPMIDLLQLLSCICDPATGRVRVPGFYEQVRAVSSEERALYDDIEFDLDKYGAKTGLTGLLQPGQSAADLLMQRWRFPALSVTSVEVDSGVSNATIIPKSVTATLSIRTVPDQNHASIIQSFQVLTSLLFVCHFCALTEYGKNFANECFSKLNSPNGLNVQVFCVCMVCFFLHFTNQFF
jgi:acetylornithine deacetylase/succinyl-diaminopimelate desuccinylase-like protein